MDPGPLTRPGDAAPVPGGPAAPLFLPPGALLERLDALARKAGQGPARIRLVEGAGGDPPARFSGLLSGRPMIDLPERLVREGPSGDVEAAFAHELGHAAGGHQRILLLSNITLVLAAVPIGRAAGLHPGMPGILAAVGVYLILWWCLLGTVLRRVEREADVFAAGLLGTGAYLESLRRALGPVPARGLARLWHPSVEVRVAGTAACAEGGPRREAFLAGAERFRLALRLGLVAAGAAAAMTPFAG